MPPFTNTSCPDPNFSYFGYTQSCYVLTDSRTTETGFNADDLCKRTYRGSHAVSVNNANEDAFVRFVLESSDINEPNDRAWIGLYKVGLDF